MPRIRKNQFVVLKDNKDENDIRFVKEIDEIIVKSIKLDSVTITLSDKKFLRPSKKGISLAISHSVLKTLSGLSESVGYSSICHKSSKQWNKVVLCNIKYIRFYDVTFGDSAIFKVIGTHMRVTAGERMIWVYCKLITKI